MTMQYERVTKDMLKQNNPILSAQFSPESYSKIQNDKHLPNNNCTTAYQVATPKSPCEVLPLNNWSSPVNIMNKNLDYPSLTPKDLIAPKTMLHSSQTVIKSQEKLLRSAPAPFINPDVRAIESKENNNTTSFSLNENICESSTSSFTGKDDVVRQVKQNIEILEKEKPYKCKDCNKEFSQLRNYKYHR